MGFQAAPRASRLRLDPEAVWFGWHGRDLGGSDKVIGHCDVASWNIVARDGVPVALIDWEFAGPVDALVELAQLCWLSAKLHDDIVAELEGLPPLAERARQLAIRLPCGRWPGAPARLPGSSATAALESAIIRGCQ